jgi:hypothetical protein
MDEIDTISGYLDKPEWTDEGQRHLEYLWRFEDMPTLFGF